MLRILHKKFTYGYLVRAFFWITFYMIFLSKIPNSGACSGRPGCPGALRLVAPMGKKCEKNVSVPGKTAKNPKIVGFFSKKAEKICENS